VTHRERVLTALDRQEPDRVPLDLGGVGSLIVDEVYFKVLDLLGLDRSVPPYRSGSSANYYDERVLEIFDIDFRHLWLSSPDKPKSTKNADGTVLDEWGITWSSQGSYPVLCPLKGASLDDMKKYPWPYPSKDWNTDALRERAEYLYNETDYAITAKAVLSGAGILERCTYLRGMDDFLMDMYINEEIAQFLIDKVTEIETALWDVYLDAVGPYVHVVQRAADYGTQATLLISPEILRKYFIPVEKKVTDFIKTKAPSAKIWFHSCGAIRDIIPDLISFGVEVLNPLQPLAEGMDSAALKRDFGDQLCFHGGIDLQEAMPGTIEDVRREVETRINEFAPGGGYILNPANHIQTDTPAENVIELYKYAKEYGTYPLQGAAK
jgi:uroporphyrinogen decarboxylase